MKNLVVTLSIFAIISVQGFPQGFTNIDEEINDYIFTGEWQQAKMLIEDQIKQNPEQPKYYFMKAYMYYLSRYFANTGMSRDSTINSVHYYASQAIEKGEQLEQTTEVKFYIGCAYVHLARAHGMWQEWWSAYWAASSCENYLEEVINEDPEYYDAYFELGVINYYPDVAITGFTSTLAWIGGMSGDRELGLKYLNMVADKGSLFKQEANIALGIAVILACILAPLLGIAAGPSANEQLLQAAKAGDPERMKTLIAQGADVNAKNADRETPLDWAIAQNQTKMGAFLRKHGGKMAKEPKKQKKRKK